jgi:hypothetical protein
VRPTVRTAAQLQQGGRGRGGGLPFGQNCATVLQKDRRRSVRCIVVEEVGADEGAVGYISWMDGWAGAPDL